MLAYSKNRTLRFRDESKPLSRDITRTFEAPSWNLDGNSSSEDDEEGGPTPNFMLNRKNTCSINLDHQRHLSNVDNEEDRKIESKVTFPQSHSLSSKAIYPADQERTLTRLKEDGHASTQTLAPIIYPTNHGKIIRVGGSISEPWSSIFKFESFNAVQSACFNVAACTDENIVVSAPTGCGKTVIFELAILRLLSTRFHQDAKIVFLAPIKALCQEKVQDWTARFSTLGVKTIELSGDNKADTKEISAARIICTTPEKWDSITRRVSEHIYLLGKVQLLLVDEAHNLGETRGSTLEAVICRMKTISKSDPVIKHGLPAADLRIIAVSATLPNLGCIGEFILAPPANVLPFDSSYRPVPLTIKVIGYPLQSSDYWFEKSLEKKLPEVIQLHSSGRPSLVFCGSKKSTESCAEIMWQAVSWSEIDPDISKVVQHVSCIKLRKFLPRKIGFHHADLAPYDRSIVEELFRNRKLSVLCCTSTLAMGVNLPAHLVVIKSTAQWHGKAVGYGQLASSNILQMMGRAGRPGLDDSGVAVIMTDEAHRTYWEHFSHGSEIVESRLQDDIIEIINAEVANKVITSIEDAACWIRGTFLFTRIKANPSRYGLMNHPKYGESMEALVITFLNARLSTALNELTCASLIEFDSDGLVVAPLRPSFIMSRNVLHLPTMTSILATSRNASIDDVLKVLSTTCEVSHDLRHGQKKILKDFVSMVRFPIPKSKKLETFDKNYVLLQCLLGRNTIDDNTMVREQFSMVEQSGRVLNAFVENAVDVKAGRGVLSAVILRRNIERRLWESDSNEVLQLENAFVTSSILNKLAEGGFRTIQSLAKASNPMLIETHAGRRSPFGSKLISSAQHILGQALSFRVRENAQGIKVDISRKHVEWEASGIQRGGELSEKVSYFLIAFTKSVPTAITTTQTNQDIAVEHPDGSFTELHGMHLFRKVDEPCSVSLPKLSPALIKSSAVLIVSLVSNYVGLDEHRSFVLGSRDKSESPTLCTEIADADELMFDSTKPSENKSKRGKKPGVISSSDTMLASESKLSYESLLSKSDIDAMLNDADHITSKKAPAQDARKKFAIIPTPDKVEKTCPTSAHTNFSTSSRSNLSTAATFHHFEYKGQPQEHHTIEFVESTTKSNLPTESTNLSSDNDGRNMGIAQRHVSAAVPPARMVAKKTTIGNRDIRDCLGSGHLSTLRKKAHEMNLLETVKSTRLEQHMLNFTPRFYQSETEASNALVSSSIGILHSTSSSVESKGSDLISTRYKQEEQRASPRSESKSFPARRHVDEGLTQLRRHDESNIGLSSSGKAAFFKSTGQHPTSIAALSEVRSEGIAVEDTQQLSQRPGILNRRHFGDDSIVEQYKRSSSNVRECQNAPTSTPHYYSASFDEASKTFDRDFNRESTFAPLGAICHPLKFPHQPLIESSYQPRSSATIVPLKPIMDWPVGDSKKRPLKVTPEGVLGSHLTQPELQASANEPKKRAFLRPVTSRIDFDDVFF